MSALPPIQPQGSSMKANRPAAGGRESLDTGGFEELLAHTATDLVVPAPAQAPALPNETRDDGPDEAAPRTSSAEERPRTDGPGQSRENARTDDTDRRTEAEAKNENAPTEDADATPGEEGPDFIDMTDDGGGDELTIGVRSEAETKTAVPRFRIAGAGVVNGLQGNTATASITAAASADFEAQALRLETLIRDLTDTAHLRMLKQGREIRVRLNPPDLGRLAMQIRADDDGVRAVIRVENEAARYALEARAEDLKQELARQGIDLKDISVSVGDGTFASGEPGDAGARGDGESQASTDETTNHTTLRAERATERARVRGGLDFRA